MYVKIGWRARVYHWQIDDIALVEAPDNDLNIAQNYFGNFGDSTRTSWYTQVPERQADQTVINWGAAIENTGTATVTNTGLRVEVLKDSVNVFSAQNTSGELADLGAGAIDSFNLSTTFTPDDGLGNYEVRYIPISDSVDAVPADDTLRVDFDVTDNVYARDNGIDGGGITWANQTDNFALAQMFEFPTDDTIVGLAVHWFDNATSGNGTVPGVPINVVLWDTNFNKIAEKDLHIVDTAETPLNDYGNILFNNPIPVPAGEYLIGFEKIVPSDQVWISTWDFEQDDAPPLTAFVDVGLDGTWGYIADIPMMRALTKPASCGTINYNVVGVVDDGNEIGSVTITSVTGGTGNYTYSWTGPNGFSSTQQNITGLTTKGDYILTVKDENFCSVTRTYTVAGSVSANDLVKPLPEVKLIPNPNNGEFDVVFRNAVEDDYRLQMIDLLGKVVYSSQNHVVGTQRLEIDLENVEAGVYFLNLINSVNERMTHKVVIR